MTAPATPSYDLILLVVSWLKTIRKTNDVFRTDIGLAATSEPVPNAGKEVQLGVVAGDMPINRQTSQTRSGDVDVLIELEIPVSRSNAQQLAHDGLADVLQALPGKQSGPSLPKYCTGLTVTGRRILQRPDGAPLIVAQVTARAALIEPIDPAVNGAP